MGKASKRKIRKPRHSEVKAAVDTSEVNNKPSLIRLFSGMKIGYLLLIAVVCFAAYANTFGIPFIWDDINMISENPVIQDLDNFTSSVKGYNYNTRRFIGYLTFALNYHVGGLNVAGYHFVNLLIHLFNAILVYLLVILTFRTPFFTLRGDREKEGNERAPYKTLIALFSALLFVSHPVQTQAVTYIVQRFTSLAALFYLLSIVTYIKGRLLSQSAESRAQGVTGKEKKHLALTLTFYFLSLLSAVCAMKTKEIAFTLPMTVILYEFSFFRTPLRKKLLFLVPILLTLVIIPLSIMNIDKPIGDILSDVSERTRLQTDIPRGDYIMTQMRVITTYIRLIFFPVNQNLDYDYPIYRSFLAPSVLLSFLFLLSIFGVGLYLFYASRMRTKGGAQSVEDKSRETSILSPSHLSPETYSLLPYSRLIGFGIFWFFITLSVESSVIPIVDVIFEHRVYLPSVGAFIAITTSIFLITRRLKNRWHTIDRTVISVLAIIVIVLAGTTYARNVVWQDEVGFWEDVVSKSPAKSRTHYNLGVAYDSNGFVDNAIEHFNQTLQLNPGYRQAHNNLGIAYLYQGKIAQATKHIRTALKLEPDYPEAHNNLGLVLRSQGNFDLAIEHFMTALKLKPDYPAALINLGVIYGTKGLSDKAIEHFRKALELNPGFPEAHNNLGVAFQSQGKIDRAIQHFRAALELKPDYPSASNNLADLLTSQRIDAQARKEYQLGLNYGLQGETDKAIEHLRTAIKLAPDYQEAHNNLGVALRSKGMIDEAIEHFEISLKLTNNDPEAHNFLGVAYGTKGLADKAIEHFEIALKLKPDYPEAHNNIGVAYMSKGLNDKAIQHYKIALKLLPDYPEASKNLDLALRSKGQ